MVPDRLSYKEMYPWWCTYPTPHFIDMVRFIQCHMESWEDYEYKEERSKIARKLHKFFTMDKMTKEIFKG
jgi:hypothetical protein